MFQSDCNVRYNIVNVVRTEPEHVNMHQRPSGAFALPRQVQCSNNNVSNLVYQPPLMQRQPSSILQNNSLATRNSSVAVSSRIPVQTMVCQAPSNLVPTAASYIPRNATNRGRNDNSLLVRGIGPQKNVVPMTSAINNSSAQHNIARNVASSTSTERTQRNTSLASNNVNCKFYGSSENEKFFIFTGTVERVIKWNKIFQNHFCFFEVIASVISIQEGSMRAQQIMLLRDKKGPILQVVYYNITTHMDIEDFHVGQVLRCVGKMTAPNILNAVSIRTATQEETETLQRLCLICDHAVSHFLNV